MVIDSMSDLYFVRVGLFGSVGRFRPVDATRYRRGTRVVCRTHRGLENGEVLSGIDSADLDLVDGQLVRRMTVEDDLMLSRLSRDKEQALAKCSQILASRGSQVAILDAEILLDGGGLYFYFLGEQEGELASVTEELASAYQAEVQFEQFADTLTNGCGPDCGTEDGGGCGDSCGSCAVASACKVSALK
jgi:cell fate regulator YaaT (PSP1 superfamily)